MAESSLVGWKLLSSVGIWLSGVWERDPVTSSSGKKTQDGDSRKMGSKWREEEEEGQELAWGPKGVQSESWGPGVLMG